MKSFAAQVRDALTREGARDASSKMSRLAELTGILLTTGVMTLTGGGNVRLSMRTVHAGTGRRAVQLLRQAFSVMPDLRILRASRFGGRTAFEIRLEGDAARRVVQALGLSPLEHAIPRHCLQSRRSRDAFLKGAFLGCGTVMDPTHGYSLEFELSGERMAHSFARFLQAHYTCRAALHTRRASQVVYVRGMDDIIAILSCIGAHGAILEFENIRITKDARNRANRAANCDSGNITKMIGAADRQLQAIALIERTIGLDALPRTLREVALERRQHADVSLEALGTMLEPPVGKSGVNHRLSRIEALARSIAQTEKEGYYDP